MKEYFLSLRDKYHINETLMQQIFAAYDAVQPYWQPISNHTWTAQIKILNAFQKHQASDFHLNGSTGYGYGDTGRDILELIWADIFQAEKALVRANIASGTHALALCLYGNLLPGDTFVSISGQPYDTLQTIIGHDREPGTLSELGIQHKVVDLKEDMFDFAAIARTVTADTKMVCIQRSRGYSLRKAFSVADIAEMIKAARKGNPDVIIMVDNCYGEFVEEFEPTHVGADIIIGSLIKNAGGGIARTGGYIAGRADLIELCSYRLTCVGMGKEVGCTLDMNREILLGLFFAPDVTANALKTSAFAIELFNMTGFECSPSNDDARGDIITAVKLGNEELLTAFCQGIQKGAPVDSFVTPEAWDMPGYNSKVIMAAGAFTMGASIELSADAPIREPYAVWMQGGITYTSGKIGVMLALQEMLNKKLIELK